MLQGFNTFQSSTHSIIYDFKNKKTHKVRSQKKTLFTFVIQLPKQSFSSQKALKKSILQKQASQI